jgi:hypothetical protein
MPGHPVNRVVDKKRMIGKNGGMGGGVAQGVADPPKIFLGWNSFLFANFIHLFISKVFWANAY